MIQDLVTFKKLPNISIPNQVHSTPIASKRKQQEQKKEARGIYATRETEASCRIITGAAELQERAAFRESCST